MLLLQVLVLVLVLLLLVVVLCFNQLGLKALGVWPLYVLPSRPGDLPRRCCWATPPHCSVLLAPGGLLRITPSPTAAAAANML